MLECGAGGQEHRNIQIPAADEDQSREIKLRAAPAVPIITAISTARSEQRCRIPPSRVAAANFAGDRAVDSVEKHACSKQQNSSAQK